MFNAISNSNTFNLVSENLNNTLIKITNLSNRIFTSLVVFTMLFLSILGIIGFAGSFQKLEADVGLRHKNVSVKQVQFFNKIQDAILNPVQTSAFSLNPLDGLGEIIGNVLKNVAEPIFNIILNLVKNIVLPIIEAVVKPILQFLNGVLDTINSFLEVVQRIANNLSGTRVALGFRIYKDIEGSGQGSSNFESSLQFVDKLLQIAQQGNNKTQTIFNSSFPKKDEVRKLLSDTVAWSDFMTVQKAMQSNLIEDFTSAALSYTGVVNFDAVNRDVTSIIIGKRCENSEALFSVSLWNQFTPPTSTCVAENRGPVLQELKSRQSLIQSATVEKNAQYELKLPPDCRYGQYFDITEGANIGYNPETPGGLSLALSAFSSEIKTKEISATECQLLKTGKQDQTAIVSNLLTKAVDNIGTGAPLTQVLSQFFNDASKKIFGSITAKFNKALEIINSVSSGSPVRNGIGVYGALAQVISIKELIASRIDTLNKEYEDYRANTNNIFLEGVTIRQIESDNTDITQIG